MWLPSGARERDGSATERRAVDEVRGFFEDGFAAAVGAGRFGAPLAREAKAAALWPASARKAEAEDPPSGCA